VKKTALTVLLLVGCSRGQTREAVLADAHAIAPESPVFALGVRVGSVTGVHVEGNDAHVEFRIDREHELALRSHACAMASSDAQHPALLIVPGEEGGELEGPIPQCRLDESALRELGEAIGSGLREFSEGFFGEVLRNAPNLPNVPDMPGMGPMPACEGITARITGSAAEPATPLVLENGGTRVEITFENANAESFEIASSHEATFMTEGRRAIEPARLASAGDAWFMPFSVPAHGSRAVDVVFEGETTLQAIEVPRCHPSGRPFAWCKLELTF
jgi:hypothetical protein